MSIPPLDLTPPNANSESENSDYENFEDDSDDDFGIPIDRPPSRPMVNIPNDVENELDYEIGWEWIEEDTGPLIGPYTGFRQCLLDPVKNKPQDFFNEMFDASMYTIISEETNKYAHRRKQNHKYKNFIYFKNKESFFQQNPE